MTPTEQDKELRDKLRELEAFRTGFGFDANELIEFITADRKRVALEARIDELEHTFVSYDNVLASEYVENPEWEYGQVVERIAELKAQQEEV